MSTYRQAYGAGDPAAKGPHAAYLGDPSKFPRFDDGGCEWRILQDDFGNPWFLLWKGPHGEPYNYPGLAHRELRGYSALLPFFQAAETANADELGLTLDRSRELYTTNIYAVPPTVHVCRSINGAAGGCAPTWLDLGAYVDEGDVTLAPELAAAASRVQVGFTVQTRNGPASFLAMGNPALRIAIMTGFPGTITGGPDFIPQLFQTLLDLLEIVVGAWLGNVGLVAGAIANLVTTWYGYAEAEAQAAAQAAAKFAALAAKGKLAGGKDVPLDERPPPKLTADLPKVRQHWNAPNLTRLPTVGEVAVHQAQIKRQHTMLAAAALLALAVL